MIFNRMMEVLNCFWNLGYTSLQASRACSKVC